MTAAHEARDERQEQLHDALDDVVHAAFTGNIARAAREYVAEEDFGAMLDAIVEALDEAGLTIVPLSGNPHRPNRPVPLGTTPT